MSFRDIAHIAGSAMAAQTVRMNTVASNLANADAALYRVPYHASADGNTVELGVEQAAFAQNAQDFQASLAFINLQLKGLAKVIAG